MGTYWLDAGGLFYCSCRDTASSTLVCPTVVGRLGGPSLVLSGVGRRPVATRIAPAAGGEHGFGDGCERKHLAGGAQRYRFAGHAVDHASGLILCDRAGTALAHSQQTLGTVVAHAGEQHAHRLGTGGFGHGREEYVDRRALVAHTGARLNADVVAAAAMAQQHVEIAWGDQREAAAQRVAIFGLLYVHGAETVQAIGKGAGELRGDVLGDHDSRTGLGKTRQHGGDGFGAAGGGANRQHRSGWQHGRRQAGRWGRLRLARGAGGFREAYAGGGGGAHLLRRALTQFSHRIGAAGFGQNFDGAV